MGFRQISSLPEQVQAKKFLFGGIVPANKYLFAGTVLANNLFQQNKADGVQEKLKWFGQNWPKFMM